MTTKLLPVGTTSYCWQFTRHPSAQQVVIDIEASEPILFDVLDEMDKANLDAGRSYLSIQAADGTYFTAARITFQRLATPTYYCRVRKATGEETAVWFAVTNVAGGVGTGCLGCSTAVVGAALSLVAVLGAWIL